MVAAGFVFMLWEQRRLRRLALRRREESICTFVRALDYRNLDTRIIRAVYEELQEYVGTPVPLRPLDRFEEDLHIDTEELDNIAEQIAKRCSRRFSDVASNPYFGHVRTVSDLIQFLYAQPHTNAA